eukprot:SAG25_NODE_11717_length_297_cov_1.020202_1_plen_47_part_01
MPLLLELRRTSDSGGQQPSEPPQAAPPDLCLREQDEKMSRCIMHPKS